MVGQISQVLASFWNLFTQVQVPGLGIPFSVLYLGVFAVAVSIKLLAPLLGIGGNVARGPVRVGRTVRHEARRRERAQTMKRQAENTHYIYVKR